MLVFLEVDHQPLFGHLPKPTICTPVHAFANRRTITLDLNAVHMYTCDEGERQTMPEPKNVHRPLNAKEIREFRRKLEVLIERGDPGLGVLQLTLDLLCARPVRRRRRTR
jgi:hypothetical protein